MVVYEPVTSPVATAEATKKNSRITISWNSPTKSGETVVKGDVMAISGKLTDAVTGDPIPNAEIHLKTVSPAMITAEFLLGLTDAYGNYSGTWSVPTETGEWWIQAGFYGNEMYNGMGNYFTATVEARTPVLTISMPSSGKPAESVAWSGKMTDPKVTTYGIADKGIYLQESPYGVTFIRKAGPVKTGSDGSYSGSYTLPTAPGTYYYRSEFPGGSPGAQHEVATSGVVAVKVLAPEEVPPKTLDDRAWEAFVALLESLGLPVPPRPPIPLFPPIPIEE